MMKYRYHYYELRTDMEAKSADDRTAQMKKTVRDWLIGSICVTLITVRFTVVIIA